MPSSLLTTALQRLHPKDDDRNLISATFHMITITLISMSLVDLTWFTISGDPATPNLSLGQFFWFGYSGADVNYSEYDFVNSTIVATLFMYLNYHMSNFAVLWIMAIVSISYYIVLLLEDSLAKLSLKADTSVSYGYGFYLLATSGAVALIGIFYNLILAHHPAGYYREDDRCLISFDDGLDTFNSPTPPPPYNVPPPPYTP
ncbi:transmembrane protein 127-like [Asbolus verrucosus]|uniref:Transmembrane protein 127-like n=1 Tax=Asbolus verrucosus TaxID=1661398 RepID=A0A482VDQ5_ASBVE|nr:transmembrane protein 127-like [Asbolus verrucosus]